MNIRSRWLSAPTKGPQFGQTITIKLCGEKEKEKKLIENFKKGGKKRKEVGMNYQQAAKGQEARLEYITV